jgi:electron transfer flavoprotein beta subunit
LLNIIVCVKQVPDPEAPPSVYRVDPDNKHIYPRGAPPVISTYDENALEAALRLKEIHGSHITALSLGKGLSKALLRKALAAGADDLVLLDDPAFADLDGYAIATSLTGAVRKLGHFDLVLAGIQAADTNAGLVGIGIAELLGIPCITNARVISYNTGVLTVEQTLPDGWRTWELPLPAMVTVNKSLGDLRYIPAADLMAAQKRPLTVLTAVDIGVNPAEHIKTRLLDIYIPHREPFVEMVGGADDTARGNNLAEKLFNTGILKKS